MAANIVQRTTTGAVTAADAYLKAVILTPGSDAATVVVRAGGASGTTILTLSATSSTAGNSVSTGDLCGVFCKGGIHLTFTGTGPAASVVFQ